MDAAQPSPWCLPMTTFTHNAQTLFDESLISSANVVVVNRFVSTLHRVCVCAEILRLDDVVEVLHFPPLDTFSTKCRSMAIPRLQ